jgi:hypothetical protein
MLKGTVRPDWICMRVVPLKIELHFGGYFHQMKVRQPIGRQHSMQTVNRTSRILGGDFFLFSSVQYSALLHLPPLKFHCADGCWDRTQDRCN